MDLYAPLKRALAEQNYETPTPIQSQTLPIAIEGRDVLGCAQTGTGKTAAFALPILDYLGHERIHAEPYRPVSLVLAPTRELAVQIGESFKAYGKYMKFRHALVYGGVSQGQQVAALRNGVHVLVATPGRLMDLIEQGHVDLRNVEIFVLDEADRMLDMGFLPALKKIIPKLPKDRQSLFFSATMPPKIRELSESLLFNAASVNVTPPKSTSVKAIEQSIRYVTRNSKLSSLLTILDCDSVERTIVFTRTKHGANSLAKKLAQNNVEALAIHGNKSQTARERALASFRKREVQVLVATDVAARGIDIDEVTHVINYDMPVEPESYVHRIGRTGRAGAAGTAISFCTGDELPELKAIEKLIGQPLQVENPDEQLEYKRSTNSRKRGPQFSSSSNRAQKSSRYRPSTRRKSGKRTASSSRSSASA